MTKFMDYFYRLAYGTPLARDGDKLRENFHTACQLRRARFPMHVLLVEDDPVVRHVVASQFRNEFAILEAVNGRDAINSYLTQAPDMVFLDINMPQAGGLDVLEQIAAYDPDHYVVMLSGYPSAKNVGKAVQLGARGFVPKPFHSDTLRQHVLECANMRGKLH